MPDFDFIALDANSRDLDNQRIAGQDAGQHGNIVPRRGEVDSRRRLPSRIRENEEYSSPSAPPPSNERQQPVALVFGFVLCRGLSFSKTPFTHVRQNEIVFLQLMMVMRIDMLLAVGGSG